MSLRMLGIAQRRKTLSKMCYIDRFYSRRKKALYRLLADHARDSAAWFREHIHEKQSYLGWAALQEHEEVQYRRLERKAWTR